jgi:crotonobetainyl-CoA:carnitine CoA-transferase CaiB-like acyl-CoA transferase
VLEGVRVLDFGRYIAGPYVGALLAEYGAEVIRIEKREGSEDRYVGPVGEGGTGAMFLAMNRNKRSITLDPATPAGREVVRRLVATADVVIANLPAPALQSLGLDWPTLSALKPDVVLVTSSAFGTTGPLSRNVGFDGVGQVMSGAVYMTGEPDQPYRAQVPWVDFSTALHMAFGTMAALMARARTGRGRSSKARCWRPRSA